MAIFFPQKAFVCCKGNVICSKTKSRKYFLPSMARYQYFIAPYLNMDDGTLSRNLHLKTFSKKQC